MNAVERDIEFPRHKRGWESSEARRYIVVNEELMGWIDEVCHPIPSQWADEDDSKFYVTIECGHDIDRKEFDSMMAAQNFVREHFATS